MANNNITKEDVLNFFRQHRGNCSKCPFEKECNNTYDLTRQSITKAIRICDVLKMNDFERHLWFIMFGK